MNKNLSVLLFVLAAGCSSSVSRIEMDPTRKVSEQDCSKAVDTGGGNLRCMSPERIEEDRQAQARLEAEERAARERLARERADQLAREEAARKAKAAEEERLAAERRRLEEEAARKARAAEEERLAAERRRLEEEAAARARLLAEQAAREAAERERLRREQEWLEGRAQLERFVGTYGKDEQFKEVADPISEFLDKTRNLKR